MSDLLDYAKSELSRLPHYKTDNGICAQDAIDGYVLELLTLFDSQNHSNMTSTMVLVLFDKLVRYLPIKYLTGEDDEWENASDIFGRPTLQNKRYYALIKDPETGKVTDLENRDIEVEFPYSPSY